MEKQMVSDGRPCLMGCGLMGGDDGFCSDACRSLYYKEKDAQLTAIRKNKRAVDEFMKVVMGG